MSNRVRTISAAAAAAALLAAGGGAAVASAAGGKPGAPVATASAGKKPPGSKAADERRGNAEMTAVVARELHVSTARVSAALRPIFAVGHADLSSPAFAAAARSLGVSIQQLNTALIHAKESLATSMGAGQGPGGAKPVSAKSARAKAAQERRGHDEMTAAVARELHVSTARVSAALRPIFAVGHADPSSPAFAAAARSLGVSTQQLNTALIHAKESLATQP